MRRFAWLGLFLVIIALSPTARGQSKPTTPPDTAPTLTSSEIQGLRNRLAACWGAPAAAYKATNLVVTLQVKFARDGSLAEPPKVLNSNPDPRFAMVAKSAITALTKCAPFSFLPAAKYAAWQEIVIDFDPHEMSGDKPR
jgi:hypothetical protein